MPRHGTPESGGDFRQITSANIVFFSFLDKSTARVLTLCHQVEKAQKTSLHVAGGEHKGIVINKDVQAEGDEVIIVVTIIVCYSHPRQ